MDRMGVLSCSAHGWNKGIGTRPRNIDPIRALFLSAVINGLWLSP
jgi:hypothetical protein